VTVFWDVAPCSLVETDRRFRGAYCLHHQGDDLPHIIPEDSHLHTRHRKNLKSHHMRTQHWNAFDARTQKIKIPERSGSTLLEISRLWNKHPFLEMNVLWIFSSYQSSGLRSQTWNIRHEKKHLGGNFTAPEVKRDRCWNPKTIRGRTTGENWSWTDL
jgi:hypothetical protein